jgi:hypothetical protein
MEVEQLSLRCPVSNSPVGKEFENVKHSRRPFFLRKI